MALLVMHRVRYIRVLIITLRKENDRSDVYRMTPKFSQQLALDLDVFHPFCIWRNLHRRYDFIQTQLDGVFLLGIEMNALNLTVQISRGPVEPLALPLVHMGPDHMTIRAVELGIDVDQTLNEIIPLGYIEKALRWISENILIDDHDLSRLEIHHIETEEGHAPAPRSRLEPRLSLIAL
jgi:hypothetical protein